MSISMRSILAACSILFVLSSTAGAQLTKEEAKCLSKRALATGKYESCVQKWVAKCYGNKGCPDDKLTKCREKYSKTWDKLATLAAPPCDGDRWVDNGDGTVTDNMTTLMWEQKTDDGTVRDWDTKYTWSSGDPWLGDGSAFTVFLESLNDGGGFAGANDWRVPTFAELFSILDQPYPCAISPCVDDAFGLYTQSSDYWSNTTYHYLPTDAWMVSFQDGHQSVGAHKNGIAYFRAVRGGW